jgi:hypothetical protein
MDFEITGMQSPERPLGSLIGLPHGGRGVERRPSAELAARPWREAQAAMVDTLRRSARLLPVFEERTLYPADGPSIDYAHAVRLIEPTSGAPSNYPMATRIVDAALRPAPPEMIAEGLFRLRALCAGKGMADQSDRELEAAVWLSELGKLPGDIVTSTLREWPERQNGKWWPTWNELWRVLNARLSYRRVIAAKLDLGLPKLRMLDAA